ncbi:hypothetical protein O6072_04490 [Mycolicibacterium neoaurum]|uniref:hypothetical protein n=1 Tax=Mycolicibacterium neoaurum TaxID=1795 RepID=UPI00248B90B0|nr:hypothetical protein [Mycolicibacterium neoaurum]WBP95456.1 hypothetical protein O7W24_04500 [Mycolicibacterium neoaurum]WBS09137.1 hypothetical protein O6072_04490 [Mycolicibacterium neoaurum]
MTRVCVPGALGACLLSGALLIGGPAAIALADDGPSGGGTGGTSSVGSGGSTGTAPTPGTRTQTDFGSTVRDSIRDTLRDVRNTLGTLGSPNTRPQPGTGTSGTDIEQQNELILHPADSDALPDATPDVTPEIAIGIVAPTVAATDTVAASVPPVTPAPQPASDPEPAPAPSAGTNPRPSAPETKTSTPARPLPFAKVPDVIATFGNTMTTVLGSTHDTVAAVPALLALLPTSKDPVADVISTMESMLTSVNTSVSAIITLPADLSALMGVPIAPSPGAPPAATPRTFQAAPSTDLSEMMLAPVQAADPAGALLAEMPTQPSLLASPTTVSLRTAAPAVPIPVGLRGIATSSTPDSFLDRAVSEVLLPLSLAALAAVALPGVGGLLVILALGIRIGYRQAKAGWAVHVAGFGRFAGAGPLGVVRSGSMVALYIPRGIRSKAAGGSPAVVRFLDRSDKAA